MIYDSHIHLMPFKNDTPAQFREKAHSVGVTGGLILSLPPTDTLFWKGTQPPTWQERIAHVLDFCAGLEGFYPFYWINPTEPDAAAQVEYAKNAGIRGLKVLCSTYYPAEGLAAYRKAAELRMPILFHSGILWDGMPSSDFNRPCKFECLLDVPDVRFALAHVSWPWTDECIALFGKLRQAHSLRKDEPDMYVDTSWGAADIFRDEIFRKFILVRYGIADKLLFAIDSEANAYNTAWAKYIIDFDSAMFRRLQQQYGSWRGYVSPHAAEVPDEVRNPFVNAFEKATTENMLNFLKPW